MARRSDNTREELKNMAIAAGIALLEEAGPEALSARRIAVRIGYTVGTLYNVFVDYEDILLHINAATLRDMYAALSTKRAKKTGKPLLDLAHGYVAFASKHQARWNLLTTYQRTKPLPDWYRSLIQELFALAEAPLYELTGNRKEAQTSAKILWAGLHGICALSLSHKLEAVNAGSLATLMNHFVRNYVKGLQRPGCKSSNS